MCFFLCVFFPLWSREPEVYKGSLATLWHCQVVVSFWISAVICPPTSACNLWHLAGISPSARPTLETEDLSLLGNVDVVCVKGREDKRELSHLILITQDWSSDHAVNMDHWGK